MFCCKSAVVDDIEAEVSDVPEIMVQKPTVKKTTSSRMRRRVTIGELNQVHSIPIFHGRYSSASLGDITCDKKKHKLNTQFMSFIRRNLIGHNSTFIGPFGKKTLVYCDYVASGRSLKCIEDYMLHYVVPFYGNTHTTTSVASRQTTHFRDEAREIIKECVNAHNDDVVIFAGNGTTGAIHKLIGALDLTHNAERAKNAVVFIGPFEHHSNIIPWKETGAKIIRIPETMHGNVDLDVMERQLKSHNDINKLRIVSCSAASNVTGIMTDVDEISRLAHENHAHVVFDYATGAPYLTMDMNPTPETYKDAIVCSPHKFIGGPGTPGLLISKKHMFSNPVPDLGGGGTVLYVTRDTYAYVKDIESREEGGTPAICEAIRCGMVFQLKRAVEPEFLATREEQLTKKAFMAWKQNDSISILGSHSTQRLPIFSFVVRHLYTGKYIHHNYMAVILNDLFGIQARGGCACAGPYAEDLLGIDEDVAQNFSHFMDKNDSCESCENSDSDCSTTVHLATSLEIMKPGFCRLNLSYFMDDATVDYIIAAVNMAASDGWKLLPQYVVNQSTGVWKHNSVKSKNADTPYRLSDIDYRGAKFGLNPHIYKKMMCEDLNPKKALKAARKILNEAEKMHYRKEDLSDDVDNSMPWAQRELVWFLQPKTAYQFLTTSEVFMDSRKNTVPFRPRRLSRRMSLIPTSPKMRSLIDAFQY